MNYSKLQKKLKWKQKQVMTKTTTKRRLAILCWFFLQNWVDWKWRVSEPGTSVKQHISGQQQFQYFGPRHFDLMYPHALNAKKAPAVSVKQSTDSLLASFGEVQCRKTCSNLGEKNIQTNPLALFDQKTLIVTQALCLCQKTHFQPVHEICIDICIRQMLLKQMVQLRVSGVCIKHEHPQCSQCKVTQQSYRHGVVI